RRHADRLWRARDGVGHSGHSRLIRAAPPLNRSPPDDLHRVAILFAGIEIVRRIPGIPRALPWAMLSCPFGAGLVLLPQNGVTNRGISPIVSCMPLFVFCFRYGPELESLSISTGKNCFPMSGCWPPAPSRAQMIRRSTP